VEGGTDLKFLSIFDYSSTLKDDQSLHPKQYTKAMSQMSEILISYAYDRKTQALGIGIDEDLNNGAELQEGEDNNRGFVILKNQNNSVDLKSSKEVVEIYKKYLKNDD
jgi:hypothetical protein